MRVIIAEDERLAREELIYLLSQEADIEVCASVNNGRLLLEEIDRQKPDIIFLDIEMPEMTGTEAAKILTDKTNISNNYSKIAPLVIFTTAYEEYALEAFGLNAIDYLLKPYSYERLQKALNKARTMLNNAKGSKEREPNNRTNNLLLDDGGKLVVIKLDDIYYAAKDDRVVQIHTADKVISTKMTLAELEKKLVGQAFVRSHRSYLVNLNYVQSIETWFNGTYNIILTGKEDIKIPVSRLQAKEVFKKLE